MNKPEWMILLVACIACFISGASLPAYSILLTKMVAVSIQSIYNFSKVSALKNISAVQKIRHCCVYQIFKSFNRSAIENFAVEYVF